MPANNEDINPGPEKRQTPAGGEKPQIIWGNRTLGDVAVESLNALKNANSPPILFQYGRNIVRLREDDSGVSVEPLVYESMRHHLDQAATFVTARPNKKGEWRYFPCPPPKDFVYDLLAMPSWPTNVFPVLKGIVRCPVFAADATLITTPGYNASAGLWYQPDAGLDVGPIPENPTPEERKQALSLLMDEFLVDFPFAEKADKANALAYLLTFFVRELITTPVPLALIEAPAAGTGKSLLAKCLIFLALGRIPAANPPQTNDDQWRKLITSLLMGMPTVIWLDNVSGTLRSAALETALTGDVWQERLLTTNNVLTTRIKAIFIMTANNLEIAGDLPRRIVWISLDAKVEHPEERDATAFKHPDLDNWMNANRSRLVRAALILIQAWIAEKQPLGEPLMASFQSWAQVLGGILQVAGVEGFLANRKQKRRGADDEALQWYDVCALWWKRHGTHVVGVKELYQLIKDYDLLLWITSGEKEAGNRQKLGRALKKMCGRYFGPYRLAEADKDNSGRGRYQLEVQDLKGLPPPGVEEPILGPAKRTNLMRLHEGDYVDEPNGGETASDLDPMVSFCHRWWYDFGNREIIDGIFTPTMIDLGLIPGTGSEEENRQDCAVIFRRLTERAYDVFRVEHTRDIVTWYGPESCYRLHVRDGEVAPITSKEEVHREAHRADPKPHRFTAEDFDKLLAAP